MLTANVATQHTSFFLRNVLEIFRRRFSRVAAGTAGGREGTTLRESVGETMSLSINMSMSMVNVGSTYSRPSEVWLLIVDFGSSRGMVA